MKYNKNNSTNSFQDKMNSTKNHSDKVLGNT